MLLEPALQQKTFFRFKRSRLGELAIMMELLMICGVKRQFIQVMRETGKPGNYLVSTCYLFTVSWRFLT